MTYFNSDMQFPVVGKEFARYHIKSVIGRGGMGIVYLAQDARLERTAALKVLKESLADSREFRARFARESKIAASLDHPNVIPVYEVDEVDGLLFIAMRYVSGPNLKDVIAREGRLSPSSCLSILSQVAMALDAAHGNELIHRDVKPHNVLISHDKFLPAEHVYLSDFGLAKKLISTDITTAGAVLGTVNYASPEQLQGQRTDGRSDIYSLGCVLYECLTGTLPFPGDTFVGVANRHIHEPVPQISSDLRENSPALDEVIYRALAKSAEDRYQTGQQLITALEAALASGIIPRVEVSRPPIDHVPQVTLPYERPTREVAATPSERYRNYARWAIIPLLLVVLLSLCSEDPSEKLPQGSTNSSRNTSPGEEEDPQSDDRLKDKGDGDSDNAPKISPRKWIGAGSGFLNPWRTGTVSVNGTEYSHSLFTDAGEIGTDICGFGAHLRDSRRVNLGRDWRFFRAVIGLKDTSNSDALVTFRVIGDDAELYSRTMGFGEVQRIGVDVTQVLRMILKVELANPDGDRCVKGSPVFGKARLTQ